MWQSWEIPIFHTGSTGGSAGAAPSASAWIMCVLKRVRAWSGSEPEAGPGEREHRDPRFVSDVADMETGMLGGHTVKPVGCSGGAAGIGPPPLPPSSSSSSSHHHHTASPLSQFLQQQQQQTHNNNTTINNNNNTQQGRGDPRGEEHHGGKENIILVGNSRAEQRHHQHQLNTGGEEEERMDASLGSATTTTTNNPPPSGTSSEFNHYYGNGRGGPSFDQHGGQQSPGTGVTAALSVHNTMDQVQNSHEGFSNSGPYNHYPNYRPGYGNSGYGGMMSPSRQGNSLMGPGSGGSAKAAMAATSSPAGGGGVSGGNSANSAGFQRFPGQGPQQQHPSGATPTLNQLLTSPSPMMRGYGSGYSDYNHPNAQQPSMGLAKDMGSQYGSATHGWGGQQRVHPTISPGNNGQGSGRSQVSNTFINSSLLLLPGDIFTTLTGDMHLLTANLLAVTPISPHANPNS